MKKGLLLLVILTLLLTLASCDFMGSLLGEAHIGEWVSDESYDGYGMRIELNLEEDDSYEFLVSSTYDSFPVLQYGEKGEYSAEDNEFTLEPETEYDVDYDSWIPSYVDEHVLPYTIEGDALFLMYEGDTYLLIRQ